MKSFLTTSCLILCSSLCIAQTYLNSAGSQTFTTALPVELGYVDASTGNLHLEIPLVFYPQRGNLGFSARMVYDSRIWQTAWNGTSQVWQPTNIPSSQGGWRFVTSAAVGTANTTYSSGTCIDDHTKTWKVYTAHWRDGSGTLRNFPYIAEKDTTNCQWDDNPNGDAFADDGSGYHAYATNYSGVAKIFAPDGTQVYPTVQDVHGNYFSTDGSGNPKDTLGRVPITQSVSGSTTTYTYLAPASTTANFSVTTTSISPYTSFGQSGITEYTSGSITAIQSITLADSTQYTFSYDSYGELSGITLPTGGTISYSYTNFSDSYGNINRWVYSRFVDSGSWF